MSEIDAVSTSSPLYTTSTEIFVGGNTLGTESTAISSELGCCLFEC